MCISVAILIARSLHFNTLTGEVVFVGNPYGFLESPNTFWQVIAPSCSMIAFIISLSLVALTATAWSHGIKGSWKRGVKDTRSLNYPGLSIFGICRPDENNSRKGAKLLWRWLLQRFLLIVNRRIEYVLKQNVTYSPLHNQSEP
jgi:hypothetical protein